MAREAPQLTDRHCRCFVRLGTRSRGLSRDIFVAKRYSDFLFPCFFLSVSLLPSVFLCACTLPLGSFSTLLLAALSLSLSLSLSLFFSLCLSLSLSLRFLKPRV